jgi:hypothetical protein
MRALAGPLVALALLVACTSSSPPAATGSNVVPPDIVPAAAAAAPVTVTRAGAAPVAVPAETVAAVVPMLVRRVFDPAEALADYGLDQPVATITFAVPGAPVTLTIGGQDIDHTAYYVQRSGSDQIWLVLRASIDPLLAAAPS